MSVLVTITEESALEGTVTVTHKDDKGNELAPSYTLEGDIGFKFETKAQSITGWTVKTTPTNASGVFREESQTVAYVYERATKESETVTYTGEEGNEVYLPEIFSEEAQVSNYVYDKAGSVVTSKTAEVENKSNFPETGEHANNWRIIGGLLTLIIIPFYVWKRKVSVSKE